MKPDFDALRNAYLNLSRMSGATPTPSNPAMKLVLVEDDPAQARLLAHVLRRDIVGDVEMSTFTDPSTAAEHIEHAWVDILVTDLDMPGFNGLELIELARKQNSWTQSLLLTAHSTASSLVDAGDLGVTDYLLKPVDQQLLVRLIHQSLDRLERWQEALTGTLRRGREQRHSCEE
ncbi:MAG: response regulator [Pirellulales bacterium]|nr:response regulator [Pirellulales bacterium]